MRKTWKIVTLVFFIMTLIVLGVGVVFLHSDYQLCRFFKSIDKGDWTVTKEYYDSLTPSQQQTAMAHMEGYAQELCREYANGERSYQEVTASFDAINSLDNTEELYNRRITEINYNELKGAVEALYKANTTTKEKLLIQMLNDKYQEYLDCKIDKNKMVEFILIVQNMTYYDAHNYSIVISSSVDCVETYRRIYSNYQNMLC